MRGGRQGVGQGQHLCNQRGGRLMAWYGGRVVPLVWCHGGAAAAGTKIDTAVTTLATLTTLVASESKSGGRGGTEMVVTYDICI